MGQLARRLTLPLITLYGVGTILGAGIYVLIGKVVGSAGLYTPFSFLIAAVIATFTGFSYAELSSRFPESAGEAVYVKQGLGLSWLSTLVGVLIAATGCVSSATIVNGFVGYLQVFADLPASGVIITTIGLLGLIAILGIVASVGFATVITLIEILGLIFVLGVVATGSHIDFSVWLQRPSPPEFAGGIIGGAFLAFYAYIGFEDMVNVAEETIDPKRNLPKAILLAMVISTSLYLLVSIAIVSAVDPNVLALSEAPLADVIIADGRFSPLIISGISLFAIINGAMIQMIMASRMVYGLSRKRQISPYFAEVHPVTQTPIRATLLVIVVVLALALWLPLEVLANATSFITFVTFSLVNLSLIRIKMRESDTPDDAQVYPILVPIIGFILCLAMILLRL